MIHVMLSVEVFGLDLSSSSMTNLKNRVRLYKFYRSRLEGKLLFPDLDKHHKLSYRHWRTDTEEDVRLCRLLDDHEPFFFARCGAIELSTISDYLEITNGTLNTYTPFVLEAIKTNAGVFPTDAAFIDRFCSFYISCLGNITDFAVWMKKPWQQFFVHHFSKPSSVFDGKVTYCFNYEYIKHLTNRKVLVVSPFANSIRKQFERRKEFHINDDLNLDFELLCYKSVLSQGDENPPQKDWFEALDSMFSEIMRIDFDVALLSCGAYGLPLGSLLYAAKGGQILHLGSSVPVLFGIKSVAYEKIDSAKRRMNANWIYPSPDETPLGFEKIEGGCYWGPSVNTNPPSK